MLSFKYTARDSATGKKVKAVVQADSQQAAARLISQQGLAPLSIAAAENSEKGVGKYLHRVKIKDKVIFSRQLSTLINAGLPLMQALHTVEGQTTSKPLKLIVSQIISDIEGGASFSKALENYPATFDNLYTSLVAAGEASGTLDAALERIANQQEKDAEIISKVRGAMVYPLIVVLVMVAVVAFMLVKVLPQVQELYKGLPGVSLPLVTRILLSVSHFVTKDWWLIILVFGVMVFFGSRWARTLGGKRVVDRVKMRLGPIGVLFQKMYMARFARTGSTLVASGVPLLQVLDIAAQGVDNVHVQSSIRGAMEKVKGGKALSEALDGDPNFLDLVPNMIRIGEQSGSLEQMLARTADYYEKEVDNAIKNISTIIEPVMMVVLGGVALTIVAAVLLPIYGLVGKNVIH